MGEEMKTPEDAGTARIESSALLGIVLSAMETDGAHHKQYALSQILELIDPEEFETRERLGFDFGIPA